MLDTAPVTAAIVPLIRAGVAEHELLAVVARRIPNLDRREFVAALQDATGTAERKALRPH